MRIRPTLVLLVFGSAFPGLAAPGLETSGAPVGPDTLRLDPVTVIGKSSRIPTIPGSAQVLTRADLDRQNPVDLHRALAEIPGVTVQEEEGFGLRPNISLRGTDPERSRNITMLEDGLLIAPAPYAAPSVHILPPVGRLEGVEVVKGSSQIKYGPRTQGGVINFLTTPIPEDFKGHLEISSGPENHGRAHAYAGDARAHAGYLVEIFQDARDGFQRLPDGSPTGYVLRDYLAKVRLNTERGRPGYQEIEFKISRNHQTSYSSYLGLTEADFAEDPFARYAGSGKDRWDSEWDMMQARYAARPLAWLDVDAAAYRQTLERNWYKVAAAAGSSIADVLREPEAHPRSLQALRGQGTGMDTLDIAGNKRDFSARGAQASLTLRHSLRDFRQEAELGVRYHRDSEDRREYTDHWVMAAGNLELARKGLAGERSNRFAKAEAWAFHLQDRIRWKNLSLVPGVRFEIISMERENWGKDLARAARGRVDAGSVEAWAWGLGGTWQAARPLNLFAGVHQGISPPVPGNSDSADSERSLNYEAGVRSGYGGWGLDFEGTAFLTDYRNLLGTELAASGGLGSEMQFNGGRVRVAGFEGALRLDAGKAASLGFGIPLRLAYTHTRSEFRSTFSSPLEQWEDVEKGDELPYVPRHQVAAGAGFRFKSMTFDAVGKYVARMRTVAGRGDIPDAESAGDYSFIDVTAGTSLFSRAEVYLAVRNLLDEVGVAARNPAGLRPTLPRTVVFGIKSGF